MDWLTLGTISPTSSWQLMPAATDSTVLRLTHSWTIPFRFNARALIGQFYGTGQVMGIRRIYPRTGLSEILELPVPEQLAAEGEILRQIGLRMLPPRYSGPYSYDWTVQIEALQTSVTAPDFADILREIEQTEIDIRGDITQLRQDLNP